MIYIGFPGCINAARIWIAPFTEILNPVVAVTTHLAVNYRTKTRMGGKKLTETQENGKKCAHGRE